jgi:hypothetical protein
MYVCMCRCRSVTVLKPKRALNVAEWAETQTSQFRVPMPSHATAVGAGCSRGLTLVLVLRIDPKSRAKKPMAAAPSR